MEIRKKIYAFRGEASQLEIVNEALRNEGIKTYIKDLFAKDNRDLSQAEDEYDYQSILNAEEVNMIFVNHTDYARAVYTGALVCSANKLDRVKAIALDAAPMRTWSLVEETLYIREPSRDIDEENS